MLTRFARFNIVGAIGLALQISLLTILVRSGVPVFVATLLAVETAILHNFAWHERWTWGRRGGLGRFHLTNGAVSLAGNISVTPVLATAGVPNVAASLIAVVACALINFLAAHLFVFGAGRERGDESHAETAKGRGHAEGCGRSAALLAAWSGQPPESQAPK